MIQYESLFEVFVMLCDQGKPQKSIFLVARPLRGKGGKGLTIKKKDFF